MLDSFFSRGFKASKCKNLLKLTIPRIKLLRNRREIQFKQMRRDIAKLLETGQEATAWVRVEHILREEKMMAAQEIVELFCELIAVRLQIIEAQRECPLDLKEAISSVCFAAPRCVDLPELLQVQMLFANKYGKEFVSAATELMPECSVNRQLMELLSIQAPAPDVKLKLLKEISEEHEIHWDPSASEIELMKPHEDLLNGSVQFLSGCKWPLPKEKHDETKSATSDDAAHEHSDSDEDFDIIGFPQVPKQPLLANKGTSLVAEMPPFPASALSEDGDRIEANASVGNENLSQFEPGVAMQEKSLTKEDASRKISPGSMEDKQLLPFICYPLQSTMSFPSEEHNSPPSIAKTKYDDVDLQDVLAAAEAAAETAECAAAAARSAVCIAKLRINEFMKKESDEVSCSVMENPFHLQSPKPDLEDEAELDLQDSFRDSSDGPFASSGGNKISANYAARPSYSDAKRNFDSSPRSNMISSHGSLHQPQRVHSMDDDYYFSYPNLFTSQGSYRVI